MPMVNGKKFPYDKEGKKAAKKAAKSSDAKKAAVKNWLLGQKRGK